MSVWKPSVTVAALIERQGRFLLIQERIGGRMVLNQPAGHLDPGESLVAACTFLRFAFRGTVGAAEKRPLDKEIVAVHWLTPEELRERKAEHRSPLVQKCVDDFLAGRSFQLDVFSPEFS